MNLLKAIVRPQLTKSKAKLLLETLYKRTKSNDQIKDFDHAKSKAELISNNIRSIRQKALNIQTDGLTILSVRKTLKTTTDKEYANMFNYKDPVNLLFDLQDELLSLINDMIYSNKGGDYDSPEKNRAIILFTILLTSLDLNDTLPELKADLDSLYTFFAEYLIGLDEDDEEETSVKKNLSTMADIVKMIDDANKDIINRGKV